VVVDLTEEHIAAIGKVYHIDCFVCCHPECDEGRADAEEGLKEDMSLRCPKKLGGQRFFVGRLRDSILGDVGRYNDLGNISGRRPFCELHYLSLFCPKCPTCEQPVTENGIEVAGKIYHANHLVCSAEGCGCLLAGSQARDATPRKKIKDNEEDSLSNMAETLAAFGISAPPPPPPKLEVNDASAETPTATENEASFTEAKNFFSHHGKPYCEDHYFTLFGKTCAGCGEIIRGDYLNACGLTWHPHHFSCDECQSTFPDGKYWEKPQGVPLCTKHYQERHLHRCIACDEWIMGQGVKRGNRHWHPHHLNCSICNINLSGRVTSGDSGVSLNFDRLVGFDTPKNDEILETANGTGCFEAEDGALLCATHYAEHCAHKCAGCGKAIVKDTQLAPQGEVLHAGGKTWHYSCFRCGFEGCEVQLVNLGEEPNYHEFEGMPVCRKHLAIATAPICAGCRNPILQADDSWSQEECKQKKEVQFDGKHFHWECLSCASCGKPFEEGEAMAPPQSVTLPGPERKTVRAYFCRKDFLELFKRPCTYCLKPASGRVAQVGTHTFHATCAKCGVCGAPGTCVRAVEPYRGFLVCKKHRIQPLTEVETVSIEDIHGKLQKRLELQQQKLFSAAKKALAAGGTGTQSITGSGKFVAHI
jgi:hypothetical protein